LAGYQNAQLQITSGNIGRKEIMNVDWISRPNPMLDSLSTDHRRRASAAAFWYALSSWKGFGALALFLICSGIGMVIGGIFGYIGWSIGAAIGGLIGALLSRARLQKIALSYLPRAIEETKD
jgi:hypothetical protein